MVGAAEYTDFISAGGGGKTLFHNECPGYDIKQFVNEAPVILELWVMRSTPSLLSFPDPLWSGVVALHRVLSMAKIQLFHCPIGWGCRIYRLHLCRGVKKKQWVSWYDTKQSDGEVPVMLELWGMQGTPSLPLLPGLFWPRVVAPDRALSMG